MESGCLRSTGYDSTDDFMAEWWHEQLLSELPKRVAQNLTMYSTKTLHMREVERQAEEYLSRGNSGTNWHELTDEDVDEKLDELNSRLEQRGFRTRFKVALDIGALDESDWDVIVDDGSELEFVETIEAAENIVEQLCEGG